MWPAVAGRTDPILTGCKTALRAKFGAGGSIVTANPRRSRFEAIRAEQRGAGVDTRFKHYRTSLATWIVVVAVCGGVLADAPADPRMEFPLLLDSPGWPDADVSVPIGGATRDRASTLLTAAQPVLPPPPAPTTPIVPPIAPLTPPLLDVDAPTAELPLPGVADGYQQRGVRPYGGGHPDDWPWGCGGSPYRTGPGMCDDWKVGCRWHVAVDGMVMSREDADLGGLAAAIDEDSAGDPLFDPLLEQFDHGPGGRVAFISQVPHHVGYQIHFAYEGIEEWNAAVVFPKFSPLPGSADPDSSEQRSLHYRSSLHSGELNFVREWHPMLRPFCGVRYIKFDDQINDFIDQQAPPPLPADPSVITTDRLNLFDLENNLIGFQIGGGYNLLQFGERLAIEGFINAGVYYNKIKYTNLMGVFSTEEFPDGTAAFSDVTNNDVSELSEISYVTESSISAVCWLNRCWALRAGYQTLWVGNVHLAEDAFLNTGNDDRNLFFHGWHAGIECRR